MRLYFDSNGDGVIDASDSDFEKLLVWQDMNQDGRSQVNELKTLNDLSITEIDLGATEVDTTLDGHVVSHESTFSIDGQTQDIKDIWFTHSTVNTINIEDYDLDFAALALPSSRGYGDLKAWHIAMSIDNSGTGNMQSLIQDIADKDFDDLFTSDTSLMDDVRDVMFRWAGVDGVATDSRGPHINGQELAFLEAMMGQEFNQRAYT